MASNPLTTRMSALVLAGAIAAAATPALAHKCDPTDNDRAEANRVIKRIDRLEETLVRELRQQTAQISGFQAQSSAAELEGMTAHARARAETERESIRAREIAARAPSQAGCAVVAGASGLATAAQQASAAAAQHNIQEVARVQGDPRAVGWRPDLDPQLRADMLGQQYPGAEETLFNALLGTDRIEAGDEDRAGEHARHLVAPSVPQPILETLPPDVRNSPGGRAIWLERRAHAARSTLAMSWFSNAIADRRPTVGLGDWARAIAPGSVPPGASLSRRELIRVLARDRISNTYLADLQGLGEAELLRELVRNHALSLRLRYHELEKLEHLGAMIAAQLSLASEQRWAGAAAGLEER